MKSFEKFPRPHSPAQIEECTVRLRALLSVGNDSRFNIVTAVENGLAAKFPQFFLEVLSSKEMNGIEAFTEFSPVRISVREDIYEGAYREDTRSRFTIAHEIGHLCLHWGYPRPRLAPSKQRFSRSPANQRLETEANQFAGAFLMPSVIARKFNEPRHLAKLCGVSEAAASRRLHELLVQGDGLTTNAVRTLFGKYHFRT